MIVHKTEESYPPNKSGTRVCKAVLSVAGNALPVYPFPPVRGLCMIPSVYGVWHLTRACGRAAFRCVMLYSDRAKQQSLMSRAILQRHISVLQGRQFLDLQGRKERWEVPRRDRGDAKGGCACVPLVTAVMIVAVRLPFPLAEVRSDCRCHCCYCPDRTEYAPSQLTSNDIKLGTKTNKFGKLVCLLFACGRPQNIPHFTTLSGADGHRTHRSQTDFMLLRITNAYLWAHMGLYGPTYGPMWASMGPNDIKLTYVVLFSFKLDEVTGSLGVKSPISPECWRLCIHTTNIQSFLVGIMSTPLSPPPLWWWWWWWCEALHTMYRRVPLPHLSDACLHAGRPHG